MSDEPLCLSIDLGTGGPKIGLVDFCGDVLAYELHSVVTTFATDGAATQDAEQWWSIICEVTTRLLARPDVTRERIRAVAVTGQWASTVPVDVHGRPVGPCLTWLDTRGAGYSREALGGPVMGYDPRKVLKFIHKSGAAPSMSGADPVGQILYLMNQEPQLLKRTRWLLEPVDYLTMRFTGVASATHASRIAMWLTDNRHLSHFDYDEALVRIVDFDRTRLPPLVPIGSIVGTVAPDVASSLGLRDDTIVITGVPDLHAAALGSGATRPYETHVALSTTSWISCPVPKKKTDVIHSIASAPGLTNDSYLVVNNQETGARALQWLRDVLAGSGSSMTYQEMTNLAMTSPPGANGVLFTPWLVGERSPVDNRHVRAGFTNLSISSSTPDLIRAVLEGVATNSSWLLRYVEKFVGRELTPLQILGGGAQSIEWCQIYANVLNRVVEQVSEPVVAQLRGAALLATVTLGEHRLDDLAALRPRGRIFEPEGVHRDLYRSRREQFPSLYERDKRWSRRSR